MWPPAPIQYRGDQYADQNDAGGSSGHQLLLLEDEASKTAAVVDPGGDALRILAQAQADG